MDWKNHPLTESAAWLFIGAIILGGMMLSLPKMPAQPQHRIDPAISQMSCQEISDALYGKNDHHAKSIADTIATEVDHTIGISRNRAVNAEMELLTYCLSHKTTSLHDALTVVLDPQADFLT